MGILNNYEATNPFVSSTTDAFNRLKPGFEAPVCIVTSLGHSPEVPSRNRSILMGLIRDTENPKATRFELRAPNPFTNTYMAVSCLYMTALDGIEYAVNSGKGPDDSWLSFPRQQERMLITFPRTENTAVKRTYSKITIRNRETLYLANRRLPSGKTSAS